MPSSKTTRTSSGAANCAFTITDAELFRKFKLDLEFQREFEVYLQRDGGQLREYSHRWLFDGYGRVSGCEEQWEFNISQLREFNQYKQQQRAGWFRRLRDFVEQLFR
jgi:hypothetical protein